MRNIVTWVTGGELGGAGEIAGLHVLAIPLVVAVGGIGAVGNHCVWAVARPILQDGPAVGSSTAGVVDSLLQRSAARILLAHTPCRF